MCSSSYFGTVFRSDGLISHQIRLGRRSSCDLQLNFIRSGGAAAPTVGVVRMIVFAIGVGAAAGAATFSSLLDQHQAQPARSMAVPGAYPRAQSDPTTASSWPTATENSEPTNSLPLPAPNTSAETPPETSAANQESTAPAAKPDAQTLTKIFTRSLSGRPAMFRSASRIISRFARRIVRTGPIPDPRRYCTR